MRNAVTLFVVLLATTMAGFLAKAQSQILPTTPSGFTFTSGVGIGTGSIVTVTPPTGATFTQAWDIIITHADSFHDAKLTANTTQSVAKGDALVVTVWYRRVDGLNGSVIPGEAELFMNNFTGTTTPVGSLYVPLRGRNQWRQVTMPFIAATAGVMTVEFDCAALLQEVQIGGIQMTDYGQKSVLTATPNVIDCTSQFTDFGYQNGATGTKTTISVTGNSYFTTADQINVTAANQSGDVYIASNMAGAINAGDTLVALFWVARDSTSNQNNMGISGYGLGALANNKLTTYTNTYTPLLVDGTWKQYCIPFTAGQTCTANNSRMYLWFGAALQTMDVGGIQVIDLGTSVPLSSLTNNGLDYPGRALNTGWQTTAAANIQKYRMGNLTVNVENASGAPIAGVTVAAAMQKPQFAFGSFANWGYYLGNPKGGQNIIPQYQAAFSQYMGNPIFNAVSLGDYKWPEWNEGVASQSTWMHQNGVSDIRAHNLIWPNYRKDGSGNYIDVPTTIPPLSGTALVNACMSHIDTEIPDPTVQSLPTDWDVVNEPWTSRDIQKAINGGVDSLPGSASVLTTWFNEVAKQDPSPNRFINDDGAELTAARITPLTDTNSIEQYDCDLISDMIGDGAAIDGYAFESHFLANVALTPPVTEQACFNHFGGLTSSAGPLLEEITEYDPQFTDQGLQADFMSDYLTLAYSTPNFSAFMLYGFWAGDFPSSSGIAVPGKTGVQYGNIYNTDWSVSPSGEAWLGLVHGRWWTNTSAMSTSGGVATINGFLGRYALTASSGGITKTYYADLPTTAGATVALKIDGSAGSSNVWTYEAENSPAIYAPFEVVSDSTASNGYCVTSSSSLTGPPTAPPQSMRFDTEASGTVNIWLRVKAPNPSTDSFFINIDGGTMNTVSLPDSTTWEWYRWTQTTLAAGQRHTLGFNVREVGTSIDQVLITDDLNFTP